MDCANGYEQIQRRNCKKITPFISYSEIKNATNNQKTIAGQLSIPFYDKIFGCISLVDCDNEKLFDTGLSRDGGCYSSSILLLTIDL
jgi:hypothetical protein